VRLLVERGANPFDTQALYNTSLWHDSTEWLDLLYSYDERSGHTSRWRSQLDYLLGNAVHRNHVNRVAWLLAHGANPQAKHAYTKRNLHTTALLHGHAPVAELLANAGAQIETLKGREAFQAACLRLDVETARSLAQQHPEYLQDATPLLMAARTGRADVIALLLDLGTPINLTDANGESALHAAAWTDSVPIARLLIERGAEIDARDRRFNSTPLGWASHFYKQQLTDYLSTVSSDLFSLVAVGAVDRVRSLLDAQPSLAKAVRNGATALFSLPAGHEDVAFQLAELLLSRGADVSVRNSAGRTAADEAEHNGLDAVADLLRSASAHS
jgi:ankyrin repeat protein